MSNVLIWDFDGTLAFRQGGGFSASLVELVRQYAPESPATTDDFRPLLRIGFPWHTPERPHPELGTADAWWRALEPVFERALRGVGFDSEQSRSLAREVRRVYPDPESFRLFEDVLPALGRLVSRGWTHVLLTNHVPELRTIVSYLGLDRYFARIFNSAETGYEKPHRRAFSNALEALGHTDSVWMIGDSMTADVGGAEALGIPAILVRRYCPVARRYCETLGQVDGIVG